MQKMQKNAKKIQKKLHISKKSCTFAPNFKNNPISNPKKQNYEQNLFHKKTAKKQLKSTMQRARFGRRFRVKQHSYFKTI